MTAVLRVVTPGYPCPHLLHDCAECRETARVVLAARANAGPHAYNPRCNCQACSRRLTVNLAERRQQARRNQELEATGQPWHPKPARRAA